MYRLKLLDIVLNLGFTFLVCEYQNVVQMCPELTKLLANGMKEQLQFLRQVPQLQHEWDLTLELVAPVGKTET